MARGGLEIAGRVVKDRGWVRRFQDACGCCGGGYSVLVLLMGLLRDAADGRPKIVDAPKRV